MVSISIWTCSQTSTYLNHPHGNWPRLLRVGVPSKVPLQCEVSILIGSCSQTSNSIEPALLHASFALQQRCNSWQLKCPDTPVLLYDVKLHHTAALRATVHKRLGCCLSRKGGATHLPLQAVLPREGERLVAERLCLGGGPPRTAGHGSLRRADA